MNTEQRPEPYRRSGDHYYVSQTPPRFNCVDCKIEFGSHPGARRDAEDHVMIAGHDVEGHFKITREVDHAR